MNPVPSFPEAHIESLAKVLGECGSGTDITRVLNDRGLEDKSGESTKWRRLYRIFLDSQKKHGCANQILDFIQSFLTPARFVGRNEEFKTHRRELNTVLAFLGLEYGPDGKFRKRNAAQTLDEAEKRLQTIQTKFQGRRLHAEVLKYCRAELLQDNYFHAVFEAAKGLAQRIRDMSGIHADGAALVDRVFSIDHPILAFNALETETEKSEHKGFAALLKGCFGAARNPLAHEPRVLWEGEDDAADYLSLISLLHRKLDDCVPTKLGGA
ncbi:MAG: TIGR02391 family protein [Candidatus Hydrogenedentes bacterium]|nr:TIGR02391 family protein [Candidatus Hydrogenedentota bacterium]